MGEEANHHKIFVNSGLKNMSPSWATSMEEGDIVVSESTSSESSLQDSPNSIGSTCSSDLVEDASSSSPSTLLHTNGPLYELSELMAQLPIKRGLSKFYQGKSQSYTSLASVKSLEDLAKKETPFNYRAKMKSCKSYAGLDGHKSFGPKATISKKASRGSFLSSLSRRGSFVGTVGLPYHYTK